MTDRTVHINIHSQLAIELLEVRNELPDKIHGRARDTSFCSDRRVVGYFAGMRNFWNVQRHASSYFRWLNPGLLQLSRKCQPILRGLRA